MKSRIKLLKMLTPSQNLYKYGRWRDGRGPDSAERAFERAPLTGRTIATESDE